MIRIRFPISIQISLFLVIVAFIPVAVMMMLHTYENQLLSLTESSNVQQARLMAACLADTNDGTVQAERAQQILTNMNRAFDSRIRILDTEGNLLADSSTIDMAPAVIAMPQKPEESTTETPEASDTWIYHLLSTPIRIYRRHFKPPAYSYGSADYYMGTSVYDGKEIQAAKAGHYGAATRISSGGQRSVTLYSAIPIMKEDTVIGIVLVSRSTYRILQNLYELRLDLGKVFLSSLTVVIVIAFFLTFRISVPLKRLSRQALVCADKKGRIISIRFIGKKRKDEIGDLSRSFTSLIEKLNARIRYTEAFSADVSHEFKNPLAAIRSSAELLSDEQTSETERKQFTNIILDEVTHLQTLLSGVRRISRIDGADTEKEMEYIPVFPFIQNVLTRMQARFPIVAMEFSPECEEVHIYMPAEHFDRLLENLIDNAASFAQKVCVRTQITKGKMLTVSVEDDGRGVSEQEVPKIFDRFYSNRGETNSHEHTGLGLSIVKAIVDAAEGFIQVKRSETLGGASFSVTIPI